MLIPNVLQVHAAAQAADGKIFVAPGAGGYDLNIIGIRASDPQANTFNDLITFSYWLDGRWHFFAFAATTDPALKYRLDPINPKGTAVMPLGFHRGLWMQGKHRGYNALVQARELGVWRDNDGDAVVESGSLDVGWHGINFHRYNSKRAISGLGSASAGCQVVQDPIHYDFSMKLCTAQVATLGYKTFSYTLIEEAAL